MSTFCYGMFVYEMDPENNHTWNTIDVCIHPGLWHASYRRRALTRVADQMLQISRGHVRAMSKHPYYSVHWTQDVSRKRAAVAIASHSCQPDIIQNKLALVLSDCIYGHTLRPYDCEILSKFYHNANVTAFVPENTYLPWKEPKTSTLTHASRWWKNLCGLLNQGSRNTTTA